MLSIHTEFHPIWSSRREAVASSDLEIARTPNLDYPLRDVEIIITGYLNNIWVHHYENNDSRIVSTVSTKKQVAYAYDLKKKTLRFFPTEKVLSS